MDEFPPEPQWQGKATAKVVGPTPDQAWLHLGDFCSLHKWVRSLSTCHILEGSNNMPGCIRYCAGAVHRANPTESVGWAKERLLEYDQVNRCYTYEIVETNKGFNRYKATLRVEPDQAGCLIEWSFLSDPEKGVSEKEFASFFESMTSGVARRLEEALIISDQ